MTRTDIELKLAANPALAKLNPHLLSQPARPLGGPPDSGGLAASQSVAAGRGGDDLNQLETAFLAYLNRLPGVLWIGPHHGLSFEIGTGCRYRPDFVTQDEDEHFACWEVKGGWVSRDASVRIRSAARQWPGVTFWWVTRGKDGSWNIEEIKA